MVCMASPNNSFITLCDVKGWGRIEVGGVKIGFHQNMLLS